MPKLLKKKGIIMNLSINFKSAIKANREVLLLPVSSRQCFVFNKNGSLEGCLVLGDLTHYIHTNAKPSSDIYAHEYIQADNIDVILLEWDYMTFDELTAIHWLNLVKYTA